MKGSLLSGFYNGVQRMAVVSFQDKLYLYFTVEYGRMEDGVREDGRESAIRISLIYILQWSTRRWMRVYIYILQCSTGG